MDTSGLESFAQNLRTDLLKGVRQRLRYWGFKEDGTVEEAPEEVEGGYVFRGEVHDDPGVPRKWRALKNAINRHDIDHVAEEAAYTWFNRLVAIRILEKNGHMTDVLGYAEGTEQPAVLYRAKDGVIDVLGEDGTQDVRDAILGSDDDRAFRQLLIGVCHDSDLLNDVFGRLNDFTELLLPTGLLQPDGVIEELVTTGAISDEDYEQVELIGWLYQFYISEKKDEVYDQSGKFEPEDIPAATQIFTPHWIVRYMVENTIGKQWLEKYPDSPLRNEMEYLVENDNEEVEVRKNGDAGEQMEVFDEEDDGDPTGPIFDDLSELELFDPAAGSGHILVVGFDLLMEMYRERGYTDRKAVDQILTENLKGLEIDRRAAQLARFALLMKAAQYDRRALDREDLRPEVYAMPEPRDFSTSDLRAYLGDDVFDPYGAEIKEGLNLMAEHGQNVGSALKVEVSDAARQGMAKAMAVWDEKTQNGTAQLDEQALHQELRGYLKPLVLLTEQYPAVAANPPYASSGNINKSLKSYLKEHYPRAKKDLFATFMEVFPDLTWERGRLAFITPPSWMFLSSYEDLRTHYIDDYFFESLLHLSRGIFGADFGSVATAVQKAEQNRRTGTYFRLIERTFQEFNVEHLHELFLRAMEDPDFHYDFSQYEKDGSIPNVSDPRGQRLYYPRIDQREFLKIPSSPIAYWASERVVEVFNYYTLLGEYGKVREGIHTGKNKLFLRNWQEVDIKKFSVEEVSYDSIEENGVKWIPYLKGGKYKKWYGNNDFVIRFDKDSRREMSSLSGHVRPSEDLYFEEGVTWSRISSESKIGARYTPPGFLFSDAGMMVFSDSDEYVCGVMSSKVSEYLLKMKSPTINTYSGDISDIPVYLGEGKERVKNLCKKCIIKSKTYYDKKETSWDFNQHPLVQQDALSLETAYNYWREQATEDFFQLHANEEELNDLLIDLYGLQDELSPRVALDDITILEDELDRDALEELDDERDDLSDDELRQRFLEDDPDDALFKVEVPIRRFLSYGIGVMMGRYRLGHDGLHIAHPNPSDHELAPYDVPLPLSPSETNGTEQFEIDDDAIVPLMGKDSPFSDDAVYRMREIVRLIWGEETLTENLNFINHAISVGRGRGLVRDYEKTMEEWLVGDFWDWHKSLYSVPYYGKKPIYWLFQSPEGHFQVLVYMHRMDKFTPQRIRQDYLQRYQEWLRREIESLESQGEETLSGDDAKRLDTLREAAADCREYDAILKDVADQQIEIDLDDGVQNNYPKFGDAVADL
ncbi:hypothetical protein GGP55_002935 [Salinibacter ruber]|uniref:BREX-1 system adenine-specific DNA-methyltransferase PglX n=1 Tax=Salinibacter ruber TaxID=146919 RepID=UPI0021679272|nr:BREX-1 system adenine-specific DNA-methyltransferase PglX [Salinibacter ruber]MCS3632319.1 hypothetical protein [Salinibacter ruber]